MHLRVLPPPDAGATLVLLLPLECGLERDVVTRPNKRTHIVVQLLTEYRISFGFFLLVGRNSKSIIK